LSILDNPITPLAWYTDCLIWQDVTESYELTVITNITGEAHHLLPHVIILHILIRILNDKLHKTPLKKKRLGAPYR
jgi:hypothetical protein